MAPLVALANSMAIRYGVVAVVLFLMALPLEARAMWRTIRRPGPPLLGVAMNSIALPLLTWLLVALLGDRLLSRDMALGMLATSAIPCTLASAAVWTRRAGGNDAVSIMVTVITNASCFLVTPFWILSLTGQSADIDAAADDPAIWRCSWSCRWSCAESCVWLGRSAAGPHDTRSR